MDVSFFPLEVLLLAGVIGDMTFYTIPLAILCHVHSTFECEYKKEKAMLLSLFPPDALTGNMERVSKLSIII